MGTITITLTDAEGGRAIINEDFEPLVEGDGRGLLCRAKAMTTLMLRAVGEMESGE